MHSAHDEAAASHSSVRPRVVYTSAPLMLARLLGRDGERWTLELGGEPRSVEAAPEVDPALLAEVLEQGGRVLVETAPSGAATIAGVVQTRRAVTVNPDGEVDLEVRAFRVRADREVLLSTARAFVQVKVQDVELYGNEVLTRARKVARILGRLISLN